MPVEPNIGIFVLVFGVASGFIFYALYKLLKISQKDFKEGKK